MFPALFQERRWGREAQLMLDSGLYTTVTLFVEGDLENFNFGPPKSR